MSTFKKLLPLATLAFVLVPSASARAAAPAPHWMIISQPAPTYFHAGDTSDFYWIEALNDGGAPSSGKITFKDTLPAGLVVTSAGASAGNEAAQYGHAVEMSCNTTGGSPKTVECATESSTESPVPIGDRVIAKVMVEVPAGTQGPLRNIAAITGGGAPEAASTSNTTPVVASTQPVPYGLHLAAEATQEDGRLATQAGSHPFGFSTQLAMNVGSVNPGENGGSGTCYPPNAKSQEGCPEIGATPKDIEVQLPPGFVGNPLAVPSCSQQQFQAGGNAGCPADTQVGHAYLAFFGPGTHEQSAPIYNVEPSPGQPAELGFTVGGAAHIAMLFHVRSDGNYGLSVQIAGISSFDAVRLASLMIWGVPAVTAHNPMRASAINGCEPGAKGGVFGCSSNALPAKPFLTMPSSCAGQALGMPVISDAWQAPGAMATGEPEASLAALTGCEALSLGEPSLAVEPATAQAGSPSGYTVRLKVAQSEGPEELGTPDVRDVEVALPEGTVASPSFANGLVACSQAQFGLKSGKEGACPSESLIGHVTIKTPLLEERVTGNLYVGEPECGACSSQQAGEGKLVKLLMEVELPSERGKFASPPVLVKLAGHTKINQATGQLTAVFTQNPQLPFSEVEVELENGPDAPLVNPTACGPVLASATLTPWSAGAATTVSSPAVSLTGCSAPGFSPSLTAGMTGSADAGAFGPFSFTLTRPDGQQPLGAVALHMPPGLAGLISKVSLCGEAQANAGSCPAASEIGSDTVVVGPGSEPLTIGGGRVFLTGPYKGAPFGLAVATPATAGPFTLAGNTGTGTEVVRAAISVDPATAAVTVTSDPLPTALDGIPLDIQKVLVSVNREGFLFNPTNCNAQQITGTIASATGTQASVSYPFQAVNCAALPFKPLFQVFTQGSTSKAGGASLTVKVTPPPGQANIAKVDLQLPKQLPSRLSTLQKACVAAVFESNPAGCPEGSVIGSAKAVTPVLNAPLTGPAYLVSHGGAAFPDVEFVLQGEGVTIVLDGKTDIKRGITYSKFESVPDAPVTSFETVLPEGPHSVLAAYVPNSPGGSLCGQKLLIPTTMTGQNGAQVKQSTRITVTGCSTKLTVLAKKVKGRSITLTVYVPAAGTLRATGKGVGSASKHAGGQEDLTVTLHASRRGKKTVKLTYTPARGHGQAIALTARIKH